MPSTAKGQKKYSDCGLEHRGIDLMFCASNGKKHLSIFLESHHPVSLFIRSTTQESPLNSEGGYNTLPLDACYFKLLLLYYFMVARIKWSKKKTQSSVG